MSGRHRFSIAVAAIGMLISAAAGAQEYPTKPITLIVPWPAGGSTDISMRAIADSASKILGQPIAVDNKAGGGGTVGPATMAAASKPDGYTIAQIPITVFRLPLMQEAPWDPAMDFTYIVHLTGYTFGVTTSAGRHQHADRGQRDHQTVASKHSASPFAAPLSARPALFWLPGSIFPENDRDEKRLNRCTGCISSGIGTCDNKSAASLPRHGKTHGMVRSGVAQASSKRPIAMA